MEMDKKNGLRYLAIIIISVIIGIISYIAINSISASFDHVVDTTSKEINRLEKIKSLMLKMQMEAVRFALESSVEVRVEGEKEEGVFAGTVDDISIWKSVLSTYIEESDERTLPFITSKQKEIEKIALKLILLSNDKNNEIELLATFALLENAELEFLATIDDAIAAELEEMEEEREIIDTLSKSYLWSILIACFISLALFTSINMFASKSDTASAEN